MATSRVAQIAIFALTISWPPNPQIPTYGIYISSRGFSYDAYFEKAILSSSDTILSPKAAFLLALADTLATKLQAQYPDRIFYNLHRLPPTLWPKAFYFIEELELTSKPYNVVYARSNQLLTTVAHEVWATFQIAHILESDTLKRAGSWRLPEANWRQALVDSLWAKGLRF